MTPLIGCVSGQAVRPDGATARPVAAGGRGVGLAGERRGTVGSDGRVGSATRGRPIVGVGLAPPTLPRGSRVGVADAPGRAMRPVAVGEGSSAAGGDGRLGPNVGVAVSPSRLND